VLESLNFQSARSSKQLNTALQGKDQSMKNGCRMAILAAILALAWAGTSVAADLKIGVLEPQKVLDGTRKQKIIDLEEEELKKIEEELVKQSAVLSPEAKKDKEEGFRKRYMEYQRKVNQLTQEVQNKKKEVLEEFNKSLEQIVKTIADKEKLSLVVEKGDNGAGALVVYSHPSLDITDRVIKELDKGIK
jgi:outer membrane protein